jgi:SAM-dependent methyltransferase
MSPYWDGVWESADLGFEQESDSVWSLLERRKFELLSRFLKKTRGALDVLEVGCGSARLSAALAQSGQRVWCVDRSPSALRLARKRVLGLKATATYVRADAAALPLGTWTFDLVASTGLLEHFEDPQPIIAEMVRVLRPGGLFYADIVPRKFSVLRAFDFLRLKQDPRFFERSFRRSEIVALLAAAGLRAIVVFGAGVMPPRLPIVERSEQGRRIQSCLASATAPALTRLDGTRLAEKLGFYYFAVGRAPASSGGRATR